MTEWYVFLDRERGPIDSATLKEWVNSGRVTRNTNVRTAEQGRWVRASKVKGLFPETPIARPGAPPDLQVGQPPQLPVSRNKGFALLGKRGVKYATVATVALLLVVVSGLLLGVVGGSSNSDKAVDVVRRFLDFRKSSRMVAVRLPMDPYVQFRVEKGFEDQFNAIYSSIDFGSEAPSKDDFESAFVALHLADYAIESITEREGGRYEIVVAELRYDYEAFEKEIKADRLHQLRMLRIEWRSLPQTVVDERLGSLADEYVAEWPKNYEGALEVATTTDTATYYVEESNGRMMIILRDSTSKGAEEAKTRRAAEKTRRAAEVRKALSNLSVVSSEVNDFSRSVDYGDDVFVKGVVKNTGARRIESSLDVQIELLDDEARPVSRAVSIVGYDGIEPNFSDDFITTFDKDKAAGWNGRYRIRIGDEESGTYGDWTYFPQER